MFTTKRLLQSLLLLLPSSASSLAAVPAHAHDVVVHSYPAKNGSVQAGEVTVEIEYSGRIDIGHSRLSLTGPDGGERDLSLNTTVGPNVLKAGAGSLGPGVYTLHWYVLSSPPDPRYHSLSRNRALSGSVPRSVRLFGADPAWIRPSGGDSGDRQCGFSCLIAQPLLTRGIAGADKVRQGTIRILCIAGGAIALLVVVRLAVQLATMAAAGIPLDRAFGAGFIVAWSLQGACGIALAVLAVSRRGSFLILFTLGMLAGSIATSHAVGRIEDRTWLLLATALHQAGVGVWIGGMPALLLALGTVTDKSALAFIGRRYSAMALLGVAALLIGAGFFAVKYIGSAEAVYGTAYGVMTGAKLVLFLTLVGLGAGNCFLVRRLNRDPSTPILRFRRFVEVEFGLAIAVLFAASSLTSVPPGIDVTEDRVTWQEIVERNWPITPTWTSPAHDQLASSRLRSELDSRGADAPALAGSGVPAANNDADKRWSAFNHNWAGVFVLAGGLLALSRCFGLRWGGNWPLVFLGLAVLVFVRADADSWPLGRTGFWKSFRDPETLQHRAALPLMVGIALFEWSVQTGRLKTRRAAYVFPLMCIVGGLLLLTHSHSISNVKELLLIEMSHTLLAILGLATGWARWLELRTEDGDVNRVAGWIWPIGLALSGAVLIAYREM